MYRIEALSDAVFGFSVSLLIMSLEVPGSFEEFRQTLLNFPPFLATICLVFFFWHLQNTYFRSYGLNTGFVVFLNLSLLMLILFYAFPLKYMFSLLLSWLFGANFFSIEHGQAVPFLTLKNFSELVMFFTIGYSAIWFLFLLMYRHALKRKEELNLSPRETLMLYAEIRDATAQVLIGILGLAFALIQYPILSGCCFLLIPFWLMLNSYMIRKRLRRLPYE